MAEKLCKLKKKGGGELKETTLWTNSSPSSAFSAQTVSLSQTVNNFKFIKIIFYNSTSQDESTETIISTSKLKALSNNTNSANFYRGASPAYFSSNVAQIREFYYSNTTTIGFTSTFRVNNATSGSNSNCIPYKIIGIN